jgi:hypothetical protein
VRHRNYGRRGGNAAGVTFLKEICPMRRISTLSAVAGIATVLGVAVPAQAADYYVIRWENTGICQIWNEGLSQKPLEWPSHYKVVSKPVPTFSDAMAIQLKMREQRSCTL